MCEMASRLAVNAEVEIIGYADDIRQQQKGTMR
jgi:hypothetical protein